ncbi:hypothetical protein BCVP_CDS0212 [Bacillus phage BC-VP]|nr:hypothetical protein BCVP_CDS0212 [Bacillus phage BC-VP]
MYSLPYYKYSKRISGLWGKLPILYTKGLLTSNRFIDAGLKV